MIRSDGTPERDYIYVEDAVDVYLAVADSLDDHAHHGRAWNAGSGEPLSVLEVVRSADPVSGRDVEPDVQGSRVTRTARSTASTSTRRRSATELGWEPKWDLDSGLRAALEWYAQTLR